MQYRFKRCIFCGSIVTKLPEICQVSMKKPVIQIFMSIPRTFFSGKSLHKINESSYNLTSETLYKNCSISRRYAPDGSLLRGTANCLGYINISTSELGVFNQNSKANIGFDNNFGVSRRLAD